MSDEHQEAHPENGDSPRPTAGGHSPAENGDSPRQTAGGHSPAENGDSPRPTAAGYSPHFRGPHFRDRLIDGLLREEFGREAPPDVCPAVVARAFRRRRRAWVWAAPAGAAAAAAVAAVLLYVVFPVRKAPAPEPGVTPGSDVVLMDGRPVVRGTEVAADYAPATLSMGGYATVRVASGSLVTIEGAAAREAVFLRRGQVTCDVDPNVGTFCVRTAAGAAWAAGTQFTVRLAEEKGEDGVIRSRMAVNVLAGAVLFTGAWGQSMVRAGEAAVTPLAAGDRGVVQGVVTAVGADSIEVRADGTQRVERYMPRWTGGLPRDGGGFDKAMLAAIAKAKVGERVEVRWAQDERKRVVGLTVLQAARPAEAEGGTVRGVVMATGENWVELRAEGADRAERYSARRAPGGGLPDREVLAQIARVKAGDRVEIRWTLVERRRIVSIRVLGQTR